MQIRNGYVWITKTLAVSIWVSVLGVTCHAQKVLGYIDPDDPTGADRSLQSTKPEISEADLSADPLDKFLENETARYAEIRGIYFSTVTGSEKKKSLGKVDDLIAQYERTTFTPRGLPRALAIVLGREKRLEDELKPLREKIADLGVSDALKKILTTKIQERTASIESDRQSAAESLARLHVVQKIRRSGNQLRKEQQVLADVGATEAEMKELATAFFGEAEKEGREYARGSSADGFKDILARYTEQKVKWARAEAKLPPSPNEEPPPVIEFDDKAAGRREVIQAAQASLAEAARNMGRGVRVMPSGEVGSAGRRQSQNNYDIRPDKAPQLKTSVHPMYPYEMRASNISGEVVVDFLVDTNGDVHNAFAIRSTHKAFESPAVMAVIQWKFTPAQKDGRNIICHMQVPIVFTLTK